MGKKRQRVSYDQDALGRMIYNITRTQQSFKDWGIPDIKINLEGFEGVIQNLPKKKKEIVEKYWGLIPGTVNRSQNRKMDCAFKNMEDMAYDVLEEVRKLDYLVCYEENAAELVRLLSSKFNKKGVEDISDVDAIKHLFILVVFFAGGPRIIFEEEGYEIDLQKESVMRFDEYAFLYSCWHNAAEILPDKSINLKLLIEVMAMFDISQVISMKEFVNLRLTPEETMTEHDKLNSIADVRVFKEKLFKDGTWNVMNTIIYGCVEGSRKIDANCLSRYFGVLWRDWDAVKQFQKDEVEIKTSKGSKMVPKYELGELEFTDVYELMSLYLMRKYI